MQIITVSPALFVFSLVTPALIQTQTPGSGPGTGAANDPGILEPVITALTGIETRIPNTDQASGGQLLMQVGPVQEEQASGQLSLTGHVITEVTSPHRAMRVALDALTDAAGNGDSAGMQSSAQELSDILLGNTQGQIFDGFAMLNYNRGAYVGDQEPGEYKMKTARDSGETAPGMDGVPRKIWEVDVNHLWYDGQFDSDTFLLRIPVEANEFDTLRVHYRIYSLEREEFSPTAILLDHREPGSVQFPFKGLDSVWIPVGNDRVTEITVDFPPVRLLRGVYTWGWRVHPPRIQFLQPIYETINAHTGQVELDPQGESFAVRNRMLTIDGIGDAAPEKKMYLVTQAVLAQGASPASVYAMLTDSTTVPLGTGRDWADLAADQRQLPPEAWEVLADEGIAPGDFGPYRFITAYLNNEMYGQGPRNEKIDGWAQGEHSR